MRQKDRTFQNSTSGRRTDAIPEATRRRGDGNRRAMVAASIKHVVDEDIQIGFTAPRATLE